MKSHISAGRDAETGNEVAMKPEHYSVAPSLLEEDSLWRKVDDFPEGSSGWLGCAVTSTAIFL